MATTPRILLSKKEAAEALAVSVRHFERHIQRQVRCVYTGNLTRYLVKDLERWAEREAVLGEPALRRHQG
jgi:hypothetical protein